MTIQYAIATPDGVVVRTTSGHYYLVDDIGNTPIASEYAAALIG